MIIVFATGRITKDPVESAPDCINFSLAVERVYKTRENEKITDFHNCVAFGHSAKFMKEYIHKGDLLAIQGRLENNTYKDSKGVKVTTEKIIADSVECMCKSRPSQPQAPQQTPQQPKTSKLNPDLLKVTAEAPTFDIVDDDLPF